MFKTWLIGCTAALFPSIAMATIVQFQTIMGEFEVNLFDEATPKTVGNFLAYLNDDHYDDSVFHRSVSNFVLQGGGYTFTNNEFKAIETNPAVINEPRYANVRGTIAMAKQDGKPNSATSQWFINLNSTNVSLDQQNGGFTVFGQVVRGMDVVDALATIPTYSFQDSFQNFPLRDWENGDPITEDNYALITNIVILDTDKNTASDLSPRLRAEQKESGGSTNLTLLGLLFLLFGAHLFSKRAALR